MTTLLQTIGSSPTAVAFTSGATSRTCATLATYPFNLCRKEGFTTFYRGLVPMVMKSMCATGITFAVFTATKNSLENFHNRFAIPPISMDDADTKKYYDVA